MRLAILGIFIVSATMLFSCKASRSAAASRIYYDSISYKESYRIQSDDKISVSIWNHDDLSIGSVYGIYNSNEVYGKWVMVNEKGTAPLPGLGNVKLVNLTIREATDTLSYLYGLQIKEPVITVRILNKEVSVLGEVKTPGNYILEKEHTSIVEIISRAEGFDYYAEKRKVKLIRKSETETHEYIVDFSPENIAYLNTLFLKSGDVIYIPTKKGKSLDKKAPTILPVASLITATILLVKFFSGN
jgi:polysaccharide export outer membrane protein